MESSRSSSNDRHSSTRSRSAARRWPRLAVWVIAGGIALAAGLWAVGRLSPESAEQSGNALAAPSTAGAGCSAGTSYHVGPDGSATGDGSPERPLDLATALGSSSPARGCDTIWLHGGTYSGTFVSSLRGSENAPIIVRQAPGERVTLDGASQNLPVLAAGGAYTWFWGFEVTNSDVQRSSAEGGGWPGDLKRATGVAASGGNLKFINLNVHDVTRGFEMSSAALNAEVYGSLIYYNGWVGPGGAANGHGIDTHNRAGRQRLVDNVIFNQFSHGIIAYSSKEQPADFITIEGNILFNNGVLSPGGFERDMLVGGGAVVKSPVLQENMTYGGAQTYIGEGQGCNGSRIDGNYFAGPLLLKPCEGVVKGNTLRTSSPDLVTAYPDNVHGQKGPAKLVVYVRPNQYEPGRAHVAVYNWAKQPTVAVDLTATKLADGAAFEVYDAQNFAKPLASGTFSPGRPTVTVTLTGLTTAPPIGDGIKAPAHTAPEFIALVVLPVAKP